jgi:hypothetical protein
LWSNLRYNPDIRLQELSKIVKTVRLVDLRQYLNLHHTNMIEKCYTLNCGVW